MSEAQDAKIRELERRLAQLEARAEGAKAEPLITHTSQRVFAHDRTANAMPPSVVADLVAQVPDVSGLREDARRSSPMAPMAGSAPKPAWRDPAPLGPPPGVAALDRIMDVEAALDRRDRERRFGGTT